MLFACLHVFSGGLRCRRQLAGAGQSDPCAGDRHGIRQPIDGQWLLQPGLAVARRLPPLCRRSQWLCSGRGGCGCFTHNRCLFGAGHGRAAVLAPVGICQRNRYVCAHRAGSFRASHCGGDTGRLAAGWPCRGGYRLGQTACGRRRLNRYGRGTCLAACVWRTDAAFAFAQTLSGAYLGRKHLGRGYGLAGLPEPWAHSGHARLCRAGPGTGVGACWLAAAFAARACALHQRGLWWQCGRRRLSRGLA